MGKRTVDSHYNCGANVHKIRKTYQSVSWVSRLPLHRGLNNITMRAYVLIDASLDNARRIAVKLRQRSGVLLADVVNGPHPIIALLEGNDPSIIAQTVLFDIRKIEGVTDLTVYLTSEEQKNISVQENMPDNLSLDTSQTVVGGQQSKAPSGGVRNVEDSG